MTLKHDDKKVAEWLREHGDYLYGYAIKKVYDKDIAFDLVQETLLGAWKANYSGDSSERTWLIGILKHKIIDHIRKQIRERELISELKNDPSSDYFDASGSWLETQHNLHDMPEHRAQNNQLQFQLSECLATLSGQQRTIFVLREVNGESSADICQTYGIEPSNLHVIMHRARLALCKCLSNLGYAKSSKAFL